MYDTILYAKIYAISYTVVYDKDLFYNYFLATSLKMYVIMCDKEATG